MKIFNLTKRTFMAFVLVLSCSEALPQFWPWTWFQSDVTQHQRYPREPDTDTRWFGYLRNPASPTYTKGPVNNSYGSAVMQPNAQVAATKPSGESYSQRAHYSGSIDAMQDGPQARGINSRYNATKNQWYPHAYNKAPVVPSHPQKDAIVFEDGLATVKPAINFAVQNETEITGRPSTWVPSVKGSDKPCTSEDGFCEDVATYPGAEITEYLSTKLNELTEFFGSDIIAEPTEIPKLRVGPILAEEQPLCESETTVRFPKMARNKDDKWMFIVNVENYTQGVKVEKCRNEGSPCQFMEYFPTGATTYCRQKYTYRKLVAVNEDGKTVTETFPMPSCCICQVKMSPLLRLHIKTPQLASAAASDVPDSLPAASNLTNNDGIVFSSASSNETVAN